MSDHPKVALVTGSTSGIGLAIAHALARKKVNIVVSGFGDEAIINGIVSDIKTRHGVRVDYVAADLNKLSDIESLWSKVIDLYPDGIDILVNNAGFVIESTIESCPDEYWDQTIAVLLTAPFHLIKRSLPAMKKKGYGRIVNMSSMFGVVALANFTPYTAAKHGIIGLTKGVALETAAHGITCNAVCPNLTYTPLLDGHFRRASQIHGVPFEEIRSKYLSGVATGKFITAEQVAELVEFLCLSNASSQMTGAAYLIDYGGSAQ